MIPRLARFVFATAVGISVISISQPSFAQVGNVNPIRDLDSERQSDDPFSAQNNEGGSYGVFDLIHRATLGNNRDLNEFATEQNQNLDAAAAAFRAKQRQLMRQPTNAVNSTPQPRRNSNY